MRSVGGKIGLGKVVACGSDVGSKTILQLSEGVLGGIGVIISWETFKMKLVSNWT